MGRRDKDCFANRNRGGRRKGGRCNIFLARKIAAQDQPAHAVNNHIYLRYCRAICVLQRSQELAERNALRFDRRPQ